MQLSLPKKSNNFNLFGNININVILYKFEARVTFFWYGFLVWSEYYTVLATRYRFHLSCREGMARVRAEWTTTVFEALHHSFLNIYITVYPGPPPPSGTVHSMFCFGSLMSHACICSQQVIQVRRRSRGWKQIARCRKEARQASLGSSFVVISHQRSNTIGINQSRRNIVRSFMRYPSDARQL